MSTLTAEQIARHAYQAGFRGDGLTVAVAVALAESAGDPRAHNGTPPDNSYGLWQINMYGGLGPERRRLYDLDSNRELFDPEVNAEVANDISNDGRDFTPWTTYTSGLYRRFLDRARRAAREVSRHGGHDGGHGGGGGHGGSGGQHGVSGGGGGGQHGGGGGSGGFAVDTTLLNGYVRTTRGVADNLAAAGTQHVRRVREIADDSFGKIGKETGFASALDDFAAALHRQVRGVASNADRLASATAKTARAYRDQDDEIAATLSGIG